jgi:hypothetical protein
MNIMTIIIDKDKSDVFILNYIVIILLLGKMYII